MLQEHKIKVLISTEELQKRVRELAQEISRDYANRELLMVGVLKGSFMFMADLIRYLDCDVEVDFMERSATEIQLSHLERYGLPRISSKVWRGATIVQGTASVWMYMKLAMYLQSIRI